MKRSIQFVVMMCIILPPSLACAPIVRAQRMASRFSAQNRRMNNPPNDEKPLKPNPANPGTEKSAGKSEPEAKPGSGRNLMGLPSAWVERLQDMSPEEQEKFLANNDRFKAMTPQQQSQIRARLQYWNNLSPDQRQELREREQLWEKMTPEQHQYVRETLLPKWQAMPPASKMIIRRHLTRLSGLNESERQAQLDNPAFMRNMTPEEQNMLRELSRLRIGNTPDVPPSPNGE